MTTWLDGPSVAFDTETTGVNPITDRIVTAALVTALPGQPPTGVEEWVLDPGVDIPAGASAIHGVTTEFARAHGKSAREGLDEIAQSLAEHVRTGTPIVVFNAAYDLPLLDHELSRYGLPSVADRCAGATAYVIDPLVIDRAVDRYRKGKRTLGVLCEVYQVPVEEDLHNSTADAAVTLQILGCLAEKYEEIRTQSLDELQDFQRDAHRVWARSFNEWRARQGYEGSGPSEEWLVPS